jgi:hypothetical protein
VTRLASMRVHEAPAGLSPGTIRELEEGTVRRRERGPEPALERRNGLLGSRRAQDRPAGRQLLAALDGLRRQRRLPPTEELGERLCYGATATASGW